MSYTEREKEFEKLVKKRFNLYNSLFLNLPYGNIENIGILIPILYQEGKSGLEKKREPYEILEQFFKKHSGIKTEEEKIDFMFRAIQYIERQVVLFDSVEESAFPAIRKLSSNLSVSDFKHLSNKPDGNKALLKKLADFGIRIVFTAHPTQFYPPSVLEIINSLRELIKKNDINSIDITLQQLGLTSLMHSQKPTPLDEAKNLIYLLRNVYYEAVSELYQKIKAGINDNDFHNTEIVKLGFWPGGDRDGNPFVTSETSLEVANELRMSLLKCYYQDIKELEKKMTFKGIDEILKSLRERVYTAMFESSKPIALQSILSPLQEVKKRLKSEYNSLYLDELERFIDKVHIFQTHFATLDIRQNHMVHKNTVEEILKKEKLIQKHIEELDEKELINILLNKNLSANPKNFKDEIICDTLETIRVLKAIQEKNGEAGCHRYIISNAEDQFSVLFVFALFRWSGYDIKQLPFDIVPLFESMSSMDNAVAIMELLFNIPVYRKHLENRKNKQTYMLGFSDGTKDGGFLKANWSIFKTKERLTEISVKHGIKAIFFDGRGGPPARGGGKTYRFYAAQSQRIANNETELTIQGQTITSKYGTKEQFMHHCEQLLTAGLSNSLIRDKTDISSSDRALIDKLASLSHEKYIALKNHPLFLPYLEERSTLKYYSKANIGSRPAKRGKEKQLTLDDLRAISYVGSWSQLKQNVPGYFGFGTALNILAKEGKLESIKQLFQSVPFFKALVLNSMMSLSKSYFELTSYLSKDEKFSSFWNILYEEYKLTKKMVLLISGYKVLMEEEAISRLSIAIREQIVLPLLIIQQYALQKIKQKPENKAIYEKMVMRSLYGNINASRNSA